MGALVVVVALMMPLIAGARAWPWWMIFMASILAFVGFFANRRVELVEGRGGVPRTVASALALNTAIGTVLFGVGHLLRQSLTL